MLADTRVRFNYYFGVYKMTSNKAPAPRTPLFLEVGFRKNYARDNSFGVLKNISLSGAFIETTDESLALNEKLHLNFIVAARKRKISAKVIWKNSLGVGVQFLSTNNKDIQIIDDLIYFVESKRIGHRSVFDGILKKVS